MNFRLRQSQWNPEPTADSRAVRRAGRVLRIRHSRYLQDRDVYTGTRCRRGGFDQSMLDSQARATELHDSTTAE